MIEIISDRGLHRLRQVRRGLSDQCLRRRTRRPPGHREAVRLPDVLHVRGVLPGGRAVCGAVPGARGRAPGICGPARVRGAARRGHGRRGRRVARPVADLDESSLAASGRFGEYRRWIGWGAGRQPGSLRDANAELPELAAAYLGARSACSDARERPVGRATSYPAIFKILFIRSNLRNTCDGYPCAGPWRQRPPRARCCSPRPAARRHRGWHGRLRASSGFTLTVGFISNTPTPVGPEGLPITTAPCSRA